MTSLIMLAEAITKDGGISADYTLYVVIGACMTMLATIFGLMLRSMDQIKVEIKEVKMEVKEIRVNFHTFVEQQTALNARFDERTKDK